MTMTMTMTISIAEDDSARFFFSLSLSPVGCFMCVCFCRPFGFDRRSLGLVHWCSLPGATDRRCRSRAEKTKNFRRRCCCRRRRRHYCCRRFPRSSVPSYPAKRSLSRLSRAVLVRIVAVNVVVAAVSFAFAVVVSATGVPFCLSWSVPVRL